MTTTRPGAEAVRTTWLSLGVCALLAVIAVATAVVVPDLGLRPHSTSSRFAVLTWAAAAAVVLTALTAARAWRTAWSIAGLAVVAVVAAVWLALLANTGIPQAQVLSPDREHLASLHPVRGALDSSGSYRLEVERAGAVLAHRRFAICGGTDGETVDLAWADHRTLTASTDGVVLVRLEIADGRVRPVGDTDWRVC